MQHSFFESEDEVSSCASVHEVLRRIGQAMPGITTPMMYYGMLYSFFSWHTEDNDLYSINYMIGGAPKTWFTVPSSHAENYDAVFQVGLYPTLTAPPFLGCKCFTLCAEPLALCSAEVCSVFRRFE